MRLLYTSILLFVAACFSACEKTLPLPDVDTKRKIVLLGELIAGDSVYIRAGQSLPVTSGNLTFQVANGLSIAMAESGNTYTLSGKEDSLTTYIYTIPFTAARKILPGSTYVFTASHKDMSTATASVIIPDVFSASVKDTVTASYANDTTLKVTIAINDKPGDNYYVVEALKRLARLNVFFYHNGQWLDRDLNRSLYDSISLTGEQLNIRIDTTYTNNYVRHGIYTDDIFTENVQNNNQYTINKRIFLTDNTFDGHSHDITVYIRKNEFLAENRMDKGLTVLMVKSVTQEYFNYLKAYENNTYTEGFGTRSLPEKIEGNVKDGLGVLGASYRLTFPYQFDTYDL